MSRTAFHAMAKPAGAACNLRCEYCFYYDKKDLYPNQNSLMNPAVLETFIRDYYVSHAGPHVSFAWQGGEPTLAGLEFFRRAVELQTRYLPAGWQFDNALQTNGMVIDQEWAEFLSAEDFLVGLSWDGPGELHDNYRGNGTGAKVKQAWDWLRQYDVKVNSLTVVHRENAQAPDLVYGFLRDQGIEHMQFIPLVRRDEHNQLTTDSVDALDYGRFLIRLWRHWLAADVGKVFIQTFEGALAALAGFPPGLCVFAETCGSNVIVEHNGDVYPCDHFVAAERLLGNVSQTSLEDLVASPAQLAFGRAKHEDLHADCRSCDVLSLCWGGCPKDRVEGKNLLCAGYQLFFRYTKPYHKQLLGQLRQGRSAAQAAPAISVAVEEDWQAVSRNDLCPCGTGRKYKRCCGSSVRQ